MEHAINNQTSARRQFLGTIAAGAAAIGLATVAAPMQAAAGVFHADTPGDDPDHWFDQLKGKHKMVFDVPHPNDIFPFAWPKVFMLTNTATSGPEKEKSVVVVFRHAGIGYAFEDRIWAKYKFGETYKIKDPATQNPADPASGTNSLRNPFWMPKPGDFQVPGLGNVDIGINQLQENGVMFCVCDVAMTVSSHVAATKMNADPAEVKKDWMAGLLPGVQVVPSGVWAVGRAQEHGCHYCYV